MARSAASLACGALRVVLAGLAMACGLIAPALASIDRLGPLTEPPFGAERFALVIGNSDYAEVPDLPNAVNDARAVGAMLRQKGYDVVLAENVSRREMNEAVTRFLAAITPGAETFFYYAGHGVELDGANYLLPRDIPQLRVDEDRLLRTEGINLSSLLFDFQARAARVTLAVLDACRDNPFQKQGTRSLGATRGLARLADPPQGSFVIYAAGAGETALDSLGPGDDDPNGVFTRELLKVMSQEGLELREMVRELRQDVRLAALSAGGHNQTPSYYDQLLGDFYLTPPKSEPETPAEPLRQSVPGAAPSANVCRLLVDREAEPDDILVRDLSSAIAACERAVAEASDPEEDLLERLAAVREQEAFRVALVSRSPAIAAAYLRRYPDGRFADAVERHRDDLLARETSVPPVQVARNQDPAQEAAAPATPVDPRVALAPPAAEAETEAEAATDEDDAIDRDTIRRLQTALARVGCEPGVVDGLWGRRSSAALARFAEHAGLVMPSEPSEAALTALEGRTERVCPLTCGPREDLKNGACIARSCPSGQRMNSKGVCYTPQTTTATRTPSTTTTRKSSTATRKTTTSTRTSSSRSSSTARSSGSSNCFIFNGARVCN